MSCSGCGRELTDRPNTICPNVNHWRAWSEVVEAQTIGLIASMFEHPQRCHECGQASHEPVSLWRCTAHPSEHQAVGPGIAFEIRLKFPTTKSKP